MPGAPPGGATTPSSAAKSTDLTAATRSMRRQQRGKAKTHLGGQCCTGPPRRGIARAHPGDGGHDADARSGRARADRGLLSGCTLLRSAPEQPRTAKGAAALAPRNLCNNGLSGRSGPRGAPAAGFRALQTSPLAAPGLGGHALLAAALLEPPEPDGLAHRLRRHSERCLVAWRGPLLRTHIQAGELRG